MLARVVLALIPLASLVGGGCNKLFDLEHIELRDAMGSKKDDATVADPDASLGIDASPPDAATPCTNPNDDIILPLIADTWLDTLPRGTDELLLGAAGSHILVKFDALGYDLSQVTLLLDRADFSVECDSDKTRKLCTSCTGSDGMYSVWLSRTDWSEATATHTTRDGTNAWNGTSATGGMDRVDPVSLSFSGAALSHIRTFAPGARAFPGQYIGFHIQADGASRVFFTKEAAGCNNDTPVAPRLFGRCR